LVLQQTAIHRDNLVGSLPVHAGNGVASAVHPEYRMNLVPVIFRLLHADHPLQLSIGLQQFADLVLFPCKLLLIFHMQKLAAAAFPINRTFAGFILLPLGLLPPFASLGSFFLFSAFGSLFDSFLLCAIQVKNLMPSHMRF
jgi:hypothetical protein